MTLSLCCLAGDAPERVAATLAPLRSLANEVIVGHDKGLATAVPAAYEGLADRVVDVPAGSRAERLLALEATAGGDWLLLLDDGAVPSADLLRRLPTLLADEQVGAYALAGRWLSPDGQGWLDEVPWWPGFEPRLVRRDPARRGRPQVLLEALLNRLDCLLADRPEREAKALLLDVAEPEATLPHGLPVGALLLPERHASRPPAPLPAEDRPAIEAVLAAARRPVPAAGAWTAAAASDAPAPPLGGDALIVPLERDGRFHAGERRAVAFRVTNRSGERWSAEHEGGAPIRLAYRWRWADGTEAEGPRTAFPGGVAPGESTVVPLAVTAPEREGAASLGVDIVHEMVRWYGCEHRLGVEVGPPWRLPDRREPRPGALRRLGRRLGRRATTPIPRVLHRVWLGGADLPDEHRAYGESWRRHHPEWDLKLWTDADAPSPPGVERARNVAERADLVRLEILRRHGGVYVDTDVECLRPIDELLEGVTAFAAYEIPGRLCNAVMGAVPHHRGFERAVELAERTVGTGVYPFATATLFLTRVLEPLEDVTLFGPERFYPYLWDEPRPDGVRFPDAYAVHHWAKSWIPGESGAAAPA